MSEDGEKTSKETHCICQEYDPKCVSCHREIKDWANATPFNKNSGLYFCSESCESTWLIVHVY